MIYKKMAVLLLCLMMINAKPLSVRAEAGFPALSLDDCIDGVSPEWRPVYDEAGIRITPTRFKVISSWDGPQIRAYFLVENHTEESVVISSDNYACINGCVVNLWSSQTELFPGEAREVGFLSADQEELQMNGIRQIESMDMSFGLKSGSGGPIRHTALLHMDTVPALPKLPNLSLDSTQIYNGGEIRISACRELTQLSYGKVLFLTFENNSDSIARLYRNVISVNGTALEQEEDFFDCYTFIPPHVTANIPFNFRKQVGEEEKISQVQLSVRYGLLPAEAYMQYQTPETIVEPGIFTLKIRD